MDEFLLFGLSVALGFCAWGYVCFHYVWPTINQRSRHRLPANLGSASVSLRGLVFSCYWRRRTDAAKGIRNTGRLWRPYGRCSRMVSAVLVASAWRCCCALGFQPVGRSRPSVCVLWRSFWTGLSSLCAGRHLLYSDDLCPPPVVYARDAFRSSAETEDCCRGSACDGSGLALRVSCEAWGPTAI
jgi:hypothetical protein